MRQKTIEEYLETIYVLQQREGYAHTSAIAAEMNVQAPSVTEILQKLQREGYVDYTPYRGATLTEAGSALARRLMDRHRVIADFLDIIGVERSRAEIDACRIEHHVSQRSIDQLEKFVHFVTDAPDEPRWVHHFRQYCETGERTPCELCKEETKDSSTA